MSVDADLDRFLASVERRAFRMADLALRDRDDALDVVQDAMLALVKRYASRSPEEWPPLFWRIMTTRIADVHRRRTRGRRIFGWLARSEVEADPLEQVPAAPETAPERSFFAADASERIMEAVGRLPLRQQQAFLLRSWEGLSVAEAAHAMACSEGSVKTHLSRAVAGLRTMLGDLDE